MYTRAAATAAQILENWTARDLAEKTDVHGNTVANIEPGTYGRSTEAVAAIRSTLETAGAGFIGENGGGPGVRFRKQAI